MRGHQIIHANCHRVYTSYQDMRPGEKSEYGIICAAVMPSDCATLGSIVMMRQDRSSAG